MYKNFQPHNKGFVALLSVIIISSLLLALLFVTNLSSFYARFDALDVENKKVSRSLVESCANAALLNIAQNYNYLGNETVSVEGNVCSIDPIIYSSEDTQTHRKTATIKTHATVRNTLSNFTVVASVANPTASSTPQTNIVVESQQENP
jgi:hypothetical protein